MKEDFKVHVENFAVEFKPGHFPRLKLPLLASLTLSQGVDTGLDI